MIFATDQEKQNQVFPYGPYQEMPIFRILCKLKCEKWLVCVAAGHIHWVYITEYRIGFYDISNPIVILLE